MFNLKKIGTAVAFAALTSFGAGGVNAAIISTSVDYGTVNPLDGTGTQLFNGTLAGPSRSPTSNNSDIISQSNTDDTLGTTTTAGPGTPTGRLTHGASFEDTFVIEPLDFGDPLGRSYVSYNFNTNNNLGGAGNPHIANFAIQIDRDVGGDGGVDFSTKFQITDGSGVLATSVAEIDVIFGDLFVQNPTLGAGGLHFVGNWLFGDKVTFTLTGTVNSLINGETLNANYQANVVAAPIPLPASVLMLVGALAGLGFIGRMKRSRFAAA
ncbi:MAG: VPLPA-CTERM sorting domain-containing protein [Alphaproteobacteria bacterium]